MLRLTVYIILLGSCLIAYTSHGVAAAGGAVLDTTLITIEAVNLSEDMSTLSSKNDELLMLIYDFTDTTKLLKPLVSEYFVLDSMQWIRQVTLKTDKVRQILLVLIEVDTEKPPAVIEKNFRLHYRDVLNLFRQKDRAGLFKLLDDEDLMGYQVIPNFDRASGHNFSFQGRYKLDKFHYRIVIKK